MNIVFALIPEKGHINPYIGPAQVLAGRGHAVTVVAPGDISAQLRAAGLTFASDLVPPAADSRPTHGAALVELIQDAPRLAEWIEQLLLTGIPAQVDALTACLRRFRADAVVIDPLYYPAAIAAHLAGVPWASVSNSLNPVLPPTLDSALIRTTAALADRRAAIFAAYGMAPAFRSADVLSRHCTVAFTTRELCGDVPGVVLAGPSFPLAERGDEVALKPVPPGRPVIYASFGSQIYHWPEIFAALRASAARLGAHLILAAGELAGTIDSGPGCQVYRYAPQRAILAQAQVFVTHGGANSFMESIAAGVPMLLSPMCNDQFHQAHFLEKTGIGRAVDLRHIQPQMLDAALAALLAGGPERRAITRLQAAYAAANGAARAANGAARAADCIEGMRR